MAMAPIKKNRKKRKNPLYGKTIEIPERMTSLNELPAHEKVGRVDVFLLGLANIGLERAEAKTGLPGLAKAISPILEDEIRKHIPEDTVVHEKYRELAKLIGGYVNGGQQSTS